MPKSEREGLNMREGSLLAVTDDEQHCPKLPSMCESDDDEEYFHIRQDVDGTSWKGSRHAVPNTGVGGQHNR
jgi:hypothetical protein